MENGQKKQGVSRSRKMVGATIAVSLGLTTLLAGCGGGSSSAGGSNSSTSSAGGSGGSSGTINLTLWHAMGGATGKALDHIISDFNASQSKIKVSSVYEGQYDDEFNKWKATQGKGGGPNIMQVYDIGTKFMIDSKNIVPVQNFIDSSKYDTSQLEPNILSYYSVNGKLYSMPFNSSMPVLYYNKEAFQKAGITTPPKTYAEVMADAKKLTIKNNGTTSQYGIGIATYGWFFEQMIATQGADYVNQNNGRTGTATQATFNGPAGLTTVNWWKSLYDAGVDLNLGSTTSDTQNAFLAGKAAMFIDSSGIYTNMVNGAKGKFQVGVSELPRPAGATGGTVIGGGSLWIPKDQSTADQQAAWQFIQFASSPKEQAYWAEATGYFPITKAAYNEQSFKDYLKKYPDFQNAIDELHGVKPSYATQGALIGVFSQARHTVQDMIQSVLLNKDTPQAALDKAANSVTQAIKNYNLTVQ